MQEGSSSNEYNFFYQECTVFLEYIDYCIVFSLKCKIVIDFLLIPQNPLYMNTLLKGHTKILSCLLARDLRPGQTVHNSQGS